MFTSLPRSGRAARALAARGADHKSLEKIAKHADAGLHALRRTFPAEASQ
jgi:hypothetical protein